MEKSEVIFGVYHQIRDSQWTGVMVESVSIKSNNFAT
jgi:hypothetical protein